MTIEGLPTSVEYTITEAKTEGFECTSKTGDTGTISKTTPSEATFTNTALSSLNITKKVVTGSGETVKDVTEKYSDKEFGFTIKVDTENKLYFTVVDAKGAMVKDVTTNATKEVDETGAETGRYSVRGGSEFTIKLKPGWNLSLADLPINTTYTIVEDLPTLPFIFTKDGTAVTPTTDVNFNVNEETRTMTGKIAAYNTAYAVTVTNRYAYGSLEIIKYLPTYETSEDASFAFSAVGTLDGKKVYSNTAMITLSKAGSERTILHNIPAGAVVTVTEIGGGNSHYTTTVPVAEPVTIKADDTVSVNFTNTYTPNDTGGHGVINMFSYNGTNGWTWDKGDSTPAVPLQTETEK